MDHGGVHVPLVESIGDDLKETGEEDSDVRETARRLVAEKRGASYYERSYHKVWRRDGRRRRDRVVEIRQPSPHEEARVPSR